MKIVGRIVMILLAAAVVVGATWAVGQTSDNRSFTRDGRPAFAEQEGRSFAPGGEFRERGAEHHAAQVSSLRGWLGFTQTLVPITIIITLVALPMHFWKKRQRARRGDTSEATGVTTEFQDTLII